MFSDLLGIDARELAKAASAIEGAASDVKAISELCSRLKSIDDRLGKAISALLSINNTLTEIKNLAICNS